MRIFATRPAHQNRSWVEKLSEFNCEVVNAPLLKIDPVTAKAAKLADNKVLSLDEFNKGIFVSQNAVEHGLKRLDQFWPQLPLGIEWFAIGARTAEQLSLGLDEIYGERVAINFDSQVMNSEALLGLPALTPLANEKILIFRGVGGRSYLAEELEKRGARVEYCELYERGFPETSVSIIRKCALDKNTILPVFSEESLVNFIKCFDEDSVGNLQLKVVVPGQRVKAAAERQGFKDIYTAVNATEASMLEAVHDAVLGR